MEHTGEVSSGDEIRCTVAGTSLVGYGGTPEKALSEVQIAIFCKIAALSDELKELAKLASLCQKL